MKILRAIGAFFAKIGRWIANTAWVQPLLIVGGIFGIIFSIPYIKKGIEGLQTDHTDYKYLYYQDRALGLKEGGKADKLLGYLESFTDEDQAKIQKEFGSQFLLAFVQKNCENCKQCVSGFKYVASHNSFENKFKLYSILVDKTDSEGEYLAKKLVIKHQDLFDELTMVYGEDTSYPLYENKPSVKSEMVEKVKKLSNIADTDGEGIETPMVFMIDLKGAEGIANEWAYNGITQLTFNYTQLVDDSVDKNAVSKGKVVRDMWLYEDIFDPEYNK